MSIPFTIEYGAIDYLRKKILNILKSNTTELISDFCLHDSITNYIKFYNVIKIYPKIRCSRFICVIKTNGREELHAIQNITNYLDHIVSDIYRLQGTIQILQRYEWEGKGTSTPHSSNGWSFRLILWSIQYNISTPLITLTLENYG